VKLWRLVSEPYHSIFDAYSGEGAALAGGRWNLPNKRVIYMAESLSLVAFERLVHTHSLSGLNKLWVHSYNLKSNYSEINLPNDWDSMQRADRWRTYPFAKSQLLADKWLEDSKTVALRVPSVIIKSEYNFLLNPLHPDFDRAAICEPYQFQYDSRISSLFER